MSRNDSLEASLPEIKREPTMSLLFAFVERRLGQATERQQRNPDTSYYTVEEVDSQVFYVLRFARSYSEVVAESPGSDIIDVLIPAFLSVDAHEPMIERLVDNEDALILLRKQPPPKKLRGGVFKIRRPAYLVITPDKIDHFFPDETAELTSDDLFFPGIDTEDKPSSLVWRLSDYELIPGNVPAAFSVEDSMSIPVACNE